MPNLLVRVGAAVDSSVSSTFKSIVDSAKAAQRTTAAAEAQGTRVSKREAAAQADAHVKATEAWTKQRQRIIDNSAKMAGRAAVAAAKEEAKAAADSAKSQAKSADDAAKAKVAAWEKADKIITHVREQEAKKRAALDARYFREAEHDLERRRAGAVREQAKKVGWFERGRDAAVSGGIDLAHGAASGAVGFAASALQDVARGAGVNFDIGSAVAANTDLESRAIALSNSGLMSGQAGPNGMRQDPKALMREAREVGNATAFAPGQVIEGLQAFAGKTGDLATGRDVMRELAIESKATGTALEDMVDAAADVSNQLGDVPNKGEAVVRVMKALAGQGKLGAVEIKDLATQMAKVGAAGIRFEGGGEKNLAIFGAFAQEARARGGAATASQAATATMSFADTFAKGKRFDAFTKAGIQVNSSSEFGKFRDPREIIMDALTKTKGNAQELNKLFMDKGAQKVVGGFADVFTSTMNATQGSEQTKLEAATRAVREEMDRLTQAAMGEGETLESFRAAMQSTESRATIFNNRVSEMSSELSDKALPVLERMAPDILRVTEELLKLAPVIASATGAAAAFAAKFLGVDNAGNGDDVAADTAAFGAVSRIKAKIGRGEKVDSKDLAEAQLALQAEDAAIRSKTKSVANERADADGTIIPGLGWTPTAQHTMQSREALPRDERQLAETVRTREALSRLLEKLIDLNKPTSTKGTPQAPRGVPYASGYVGPYE